MRKNKKQKKKNMHVGGRLGASLSFGFSKTTIWSSIN